jgi:hypothetical protein
MAATTTAPSTDDPRRITEADPDFVRLKAKTERQLNASIQQYVADLLRDGQQGADRAASQFIQRQLTILRDAYLAAYAEGQRDYWQSVSNKRHAVAPMTPRQVAVMRDRLMWYGAASVTKMAREAQSAYHAEQVVSLPKAQTFADASGAGALNQWQDGVGVRVNLQADLTWGALQDGYVDAGAGDVGSPYALIYWDLEPGAQHCHDCPDMAVGSPYDPPGSGGNELDQTPGDGRTECGAACKCDLNYSPPGLGKTISWEDIFPPDMPQMQQVAPTDQGAPTARGRRVAPPSAGADGAESRDDGHEPQYRREVLQPQPTAEDAPLTTDQKAALDQFRAAAVAWDAVRGAFGAVPPMFASADSLTADELQALGPATWGELTPDQQRAFVELFAALVAWDEATKAANGGASQQNTLREPVVDGHIELFNPNHDAKGRFAPGGNGGAKAEGAGRGGKAKAEKGEGEKAPKAVRAIRAVKAAKGGGGESSGEAKAEKAPAKPRVARVPRAAKVQPVEQIVEPTALKPRAEESSHPAHAKLETLRQEVVAKASAAREAEANLHNTHAVVERHETRLAKASFSTRNFDPKLYAAQIAENEAYNQYQRARAASEHAQHVYESARADVAAGREIGHAPALHEFSGPENMRPPFSAAEFEAAHLKPLGAASGITESYTTTINGVKYQVKIPDQASVRYGSTMWSESYAEVATSRIAHEYGLGQHTVDTYSFAHNGQQYTATRWQEGAKPAGLEQSGVTRIGKALSDEQIASLQLHEYLMHDSDRHGLNYLIDSAHGGFYEIDMARGLLGNEMHAGNWEGGESYLTMAWRGNTKAELAGERVRRPSFEQVSARMRYPKAQLQRMVDAEPRVMAAAKAYHIDEHARGYLAQRFAVLRSLSHLERPTYQDLIDRVGTMGRARPEFEGMFRGRKIVGATVDFAKQEAANAGNAENGGRAAGSRRRRRQP